MFNIASSRLDKARQAERILQELEAQEHAIGWPPDRATVVHRRYVRGMTSVRITRRCHRRNRRARRRVRRAAPKSGSSDGEPEPSRHLRHGGAS